VNSRLVLHTAVCLGISLFVLDDRASAETGRFQQSGTLPGGGIYSIHSDLTAPLTAIELWFRAPAAGYDSRYAGISRLAVTALAASRPPHGTALAELVNRFGGTLRIQIYPDVAMIGANVPAQSASAVLRALTQAFFTPSVGDEALKAAVRDAAIAAAQVQYDPPRTLQDLLFAQLFRDGPAHFAPTPAASAFSAIPLAALQAYAQRAFREQNAILAIAGKVDDELLAGVAPGRPGSAMDAPIDSTLAPQPSDSTQSGTAAGVGFAWVGAPISSVREATALDFVADYLFDGDHGTIATALERSHANLFVDGQFVTLHDPGVLIVTTSGADAPSVQQAILDAVAQMQTPIEAGIFAAAQRAFEYHIVQQIQTPAGQADSLGWYAAEGNAAYAPGDASQTYMNAAQSLDPSFVAATVRKYLQHPAIVRLNAARGSGSAA